MNSIDFGLISLAVLIGLFLWQVVDSATSDTWTGLFLIAMGFLLVGFIKLIVEIVHIYRGHPE